MNKVTSKKQGFVSDVNDLINANPDDKNDIHCSHMKYHHYYSNDGDVNAIDHHQPNVKFGTNKANIVAAILAGGKASRLGGIAKGNLLIKNGAITGELAADININDNSDNPSENTHMDVDGNKTIVWRLLNEIKIAGINQTIIVANNVAVYAAYGVKVIADLYRDIGPLAGIVTALDYHIKHNSGCEAVLILPCDLPKFSSCEMKRLIDFYYAGYPIVFAATTKDQHHPLCAVVSCAMLPKLQQAIMVGRNKINTLWCELDARVVMFDSDEERDKFRNINTVDDL